MRYRILGPLEVWEDGRLVPLGGPKQKALLVALLLQANRVVSADALIAALWGEDPPSTAVAQLHTHVSGLRKALGADVIVRRSPGYLIGVPPGELDLEVFQGAVATARAALREGRAAEAADGLNEALELWRGPALGDVTEPLARGEAARLAEFELTAREERIEADLALGRHAEIVDELTGLVAEFPLRERLRGQLMLALYRSGRQADALETYREARTVLVDELGLEPGPALQRMEQAILEADPGLGAAAEHHPPPRYGPSPPHQLPPGIADFTGRQKLVGQVVTLLDTENMPESVPLVGLTGQGGVGKTILAVHVAHRLTERFPDGHLYVSLRGNEPRPVEPADVLERFLRALGVDASAVPEALEDRSALFRSRVHGRKILVVLDNADSVGQVRPLLPGAPGCAVLATGRMPLAGLEGVRIVDLDVFEPDDALELFIRIVGAERVAREPEAVQQILTLCGYLPLAVRIAAARLAARAHWSIAKLARRLGDERRRLNELAAGDLEVRACVTLSYQWLGPEARRLFRMLGTLDAPDFGLPVVAAVLDGDVERAEELVDTLLDAQLLEVGAQGARYRFHDLVRLYARERALEVESEESRRDTVVRALSAWLALAELADRELPGQALGEIKGRAPRLHLSDEMLEAPPSAEEEPLAWFDAERAALVAAVGQACASGQAELGWNLAAVLTNYFDQRGLYGDWRGTHERCLRACRDERNVLGQAVMLRGLAELSTLAETSDDCLPQAQSAVELFRALGESVGEVDALVLCGAVHRERGAQEEAMACGEAALNRAVEIGYPLGELHALEGLGFGSREQGRLEEAARRFERCLELARQLGKRREEAAALRALGIVHREQGDHDMSVSRFGAALAIFREMGHRLSEAYALVGLGELYVRQGSAKAREAVGQSLALFTDLGSDFGRAVALRVLGELELAEGAPGTAEQRLADSVRMWRDLRIPFGLALALRGLGQAYAACGAEDSARAAWTEARALFAEVDPAQTAELDRLLARPAPS
ncbi:MAG: tetratricopeptide repeat protein [Streptosporangiales bacterium]|nr:tetratricopeptide repeat protein [Streptosporangiales bacterium]